MNNAIGRVPLIINGECQDQSLSDHHCDGDDDVCQTDGGDDEDKDRML